LLEEHKCEFQELPTHNLQTLKLHTDEVWMLKWSKSGRYLVSVAKKRVFALWELDLDSSKITLVIFVYLQKHVITNAHLKDINSVEFSPNDDKIATG
jgi:WD40 repeat protein